MNRTNHSGQQAHLVDALSAADPSVRLRTALTAGTHPKPQFLDALVDRCAVEPDFFVRDMLTWALCRLQAESTVPRLVQELESGTVLARSQALHTLSKIGDQLAWPAVVALLHDEDDEVARSAWRAAVALVPDGNEASLAADLATALGRGDHQLQLSLSRAMVGLGEPVLAILETARTSSDPRIRAHAEATERLHLDPDSGFTISIEAAKRTAVIGLGT